MTEPNPDLDARLARLAARKAATGNRAAPEPPSAATASGPTRPTGARRGRRKHPAAAGRILSFGLSSSAFLSMVAAFAQTGAAGTSTAAIVTTPVTARVRTKVVVKDVHHAVYVDQFGRPVAAPSVPTGATIAPAGSQPAAGASPGHSGASVPSGGATSSAPWPGAGSSSNTPPPVSSPPPTSGLTPPAPGGGPTPTTAHVTPPPTVPPTTPTTAHVTPPTTVPPPPPPPPCTGSKCP